MKNRNETVFNVMDVRMVDMYLGGGGCLINSCANDGSFYLFSLDY